MDVACSLLIVGEVFIDFTVRRHDVDCKLRLGGIVHAARGLWASNVRYSVAAVCPNYLVDQAERYLKAHGCAEFIWLGDVKAAPNVIVIGDATEVADQGYEELLRDEKKPIILDVAGVLKGYSEILMFPGCFKVPSLRGLFSSDAHFSFDIAYDVASLSELESYRGNIRALIISTSSKLFLELGSNDFNSFLFAIEKLSPERFLLKENRGGSRLFDFGTGEVVQIPADLHETINSVGVGDVYSAVLVALHNKGWMEAAWRSARVAAVYSITTYPDDFKRDVQRDFKVSFNDIQSLGGTCLPWHDRQKFGIYLAAPDFSYVRKPEIDKAFDALIYHNFLVRRPIVENGELPRNAKALEQQAAYVKDLQLLRQCEVVFAIPLERDPGTLVEIGIGIALGKPVITFDPRRENNNTMVVGGSVAYSENLGLCLNGVFQAMSKLNQARKQ